jgi:hypothetical protein
MRFRMGGLALAVLAMAAAMPGDARADSGVPMADSMAAAGPPEQITHVIQVQAAMTFDVTTLTKLVHDSVQLASATVAVDSLGAKALALRSLVQAPAVRATFTTWRNSYGYERQRADSLTSLSMAMFSTSHRTPTLSRSRHAAPSPVIFAHSGYHGWKRGASSRTTTGRLQV